MIPEGELYYFCTPNGDRPAADGVEVLPVDEFLADEPACKALWNLLGQHFRTRSKFLAVWPSVRFVALHREPDGTVNGLLLVSAPVNWQIDYVVVRPEARGRGIALALVNSALNEAAAHKVPYVMLTSRESLRPLYEGCCGFTVVGAANPVAPQLAAAVP